MTRDWERAVRRGDIESLDRLWTPEVDVDARDGHGQTALMIAAREGHGPAVTWLVERGAALDHTAKYGLSALMIAVVRGHVDVVRRLVAAGANRNLRGTGAPGFANKSASDLAAARDDLAMIEILRSETQPSVTENPHFATASSWQTAAAMLAFRPMQPQYTAGRSLDALRIHIRDHKLRELALGERTLEAHYGGFALSQCQKGAEDARRLALVVAYGASPREVLIGGRSGRVYELGPETDPEDIDGRSPAVVAWHDGEMFYLVASSEMSVDVLLDIANSIYP